MSLMGILDTTKLALSSFQTAIDVVGSNISNVNTPGYSRQRPVFGAVGRIDVKASKVQIGVEVNDVERIYNNFLRDQINQRISSTSYGETLSASLASIEAMSNETGGNGINDLLNKFWNAWSDVSNSPASQPVRNALMSATDALCASIHDYGKVLDSVRNDAESNIRTTLIDINQLTSNIADINRKISEAGTLNGNCNTLQDKRDEYLKQLCSAASVSYFTDSSGALNVFLPNGEPLIEKEVSWRLKLSESTSTISPPYHDIVKESSNGSLSHVITGGKIGALLTVRDKIVKNYHDELDSFAAGLVVQVNEQHKSGFDEYHAAGLDFFDPAATDAKSIKVTTELASDMRKIAASSTILGGGGNAGLISAIRNKTSDLTGQLTLNNFSASLIGKVGQDIADAKRNGEHQSSMLEQINNQRESVSGVSIDEEMMKLIQYQMGYNAAGRLCSVVDEMLDTLINLGR